MTTLTVKLTPAMAKGLARAADLLKLSHEDAATEAVRLFVRNCAPEPPRKRRTR